MNKAISTILLVVASIAGYSQNYECIKPSQIQYFTNSAGYIRAIRIDSVKTLGSDTILYPFKTYRGRYLGINNKPPHPQLDSNGGCWIGGRVVKKPGGIYYFENKDNTNLVINSQAVLNEKWAFYSLTPQPWKYEAEVTSIDTMTIAGVLDSVKTITIVNQGFPHPPGSAKILLSKEHGFVEIFDLYLFPAMYIWSSRGNDFYNDFIPDPKGQFVQTEVKGMYNNDYFDFGINDTFQKVTGNVQGYITYTWVVKSIDTVNGAKRVISDFYIDKQQYADTFLADTNLYFHAIPEDSRYAQSFFLYYVSDTNTYCSTSPMIKYKRGALNNGVYAENIQTSLDSRSYKWSKVGLGEVSGYQASAMGSASKTTEMSYYSIGGVRCGIVAWPSSIWDKKQERGYKVYPIPANDALTVKFTETESTYAVSLTSISGKLVYAHQNCRGTVGIDVRNTSPGIYILTVQDDGGNINRQKIVVGAN